MPLSVRAHGTRSAAQTPILVGGPALGGSVHPDLPSAAPRGGSPFEPCQGGHTERTYMPVSGRAFIDPLR